MTPASRRRINERRSSGAASRRIRDRRARTRSSTPWSPASVERWLRFEAPGRRAPYWGSPSSDTTGVPVLGFGRSAGCLSGLAAIVTVTLMLQSVTGGPERKLARAPTGGTRACTAVLLAELPHELADQASESSKRDRRVACDRDPAAPAPRPASIHVCAPSGDVARARSSRSVLSDVSAQPRALAPGVTSTVIGQLSVLRGALTVATRCGRSPRTLPWSGSTIATPR